MKRPLESPPTKSSEPPAWSPPPTDWRMATLELESSDSRDLVAAALRLADGSQADYNPLVFCGPRGTGKTARLREFARRWSNRAPNDGVRFSTAVDFARSYATALETGGLADFRQNRISGRLWLIDGLCQITGKHEAQWELLQLIETRVAADNWVVVAAEHPLSTSALIPQLVGCLSSGLTVPLEHPDREMRRRVIEDLCIQQDVRLSPQAATTLCEQTRTLRQLEHVVLQLAARYPDHDSIGERQLTEIMVAAFPSPHPRSIVASVARRFGLSARDLRGTSRRRHVVRARGIAMLLIRQQTKLSLQEIGGLFGKRDHSTALHAIHQATHQLQQDPHLRNKIGKIELTVSKSL